MLQQKYNWILKCLQVPPIKAHFRILWSWLLYSTEEPDPWSSYSTADPDPTACDPDPGAVIPDPLYLVTPWSRGYRNRKPIQRIRFLWFGLRETQSYNIDESVWYNYVYNIYAKLNLFIKSLFKLLINLLH